MHILTSSRYLHTSVRYKQTPAALLQSVCWKVIANQAFGSVLPAEFLRILVKVFAKIEGTLFSTLRPKDVMLASNKGMCICWSSTVFNIPQLAPPKSKTQHLPRAASPSTAQPHCLLPPRHSPWSVPCLQWRAPKSSRYWDALVSLVFSSSVCRGITSLVCALRWLFVITKCSVLFYIPAHVRCHPALPLPLVLWWGNMTTDFLGLLRCLNAGRFGASL